MTVLNKKALQVISLQDYIKKVNDPRETEFKPISS